VTATLSVARALRGALLVHGPQPPPTLLSGHDEGGGVTAAPHAAFLALPAPRRETELRHLAIALPGDDALSSGMHAETGLVAGALEAWAAASGGDLRLRAGWAGAHTLHPAGREPVPAPWSLRSRRWRTVTPVALDRHPRHLNHSDPTRRAAAAARVVESLATACRRVGLPSPARVRWTRRAGGAAVAAWAFPPFPGKGRGTARVMVHADITFDTPVRGPIVLGAGRHFGLGLCRPISAA